VKIENCFDYNLNVNVIPGHIIAAGKRVELKLQESLKDMTLAEE